jgi:hypothetical protein
MDDDRGGSFTPRENSRTQIIGWMTSSEKIRGENLSSPYRKPAPGNGDAVPSGGKFDPSIKLALAV